MKTGWIARVPVTLHPTNPWDIGGDRYPLTITVTYTVAGETAPRMLSGAHRGDRSGADRDVRDGSRRRDPSALVLRRGHRPMEAHAMSVNEGYAIETDGLTRRFGAFVAVDGVKLRIPKGHLLRIPRTERRRQDDDHPHADDAAAAECEAQRSCGDTM